MSLPASLAEAVRHALRAIDREVAARTPCAILHLCTASGALPWAPGMALARAHAAKPLVDVWVLDEDDNVAERLQEGTTVQGRVATTGRMVSVRVAKVKVIEDDSVLSVGVVDDRGQQFVILCAAEVYLPFLQRYEAIVQLLKQRNRDVAAADALEMVRCAALTTGIRLICWPPLPQLEEAQRRELAADRHAALSFMKEAGLDRAVRSYVLQAVRVLAAA